MVAASKTREPSKPAADIAVNIKPFERHLKAENLSPRTIETYIESTGQFARFLAEQGMSHDIANIHREQIESFISDLLGRFKPATANNRIRGLQSFFRWLLDEGEIKTSPMDRMKPPRVPEQPPAVLGEPQLRALLKTCESGPSSDARRDSAALRLFIDTGARFAEVAGLRFSETDDEHNDVDLDQGLVRVLGKGRRERLLAIGKKTVKALDRYLRARAVTMTPPHPPPSAPSTPTGA
jgi:site-specific recombinase XerD